MIRPLDWKRHSKDHDLETWLKIATRGLCAESGLRIRTEIESHCAEAVENLVAAGHNENGARRSVLDSLGSPRLAAKEFRRHHLTKLEAGLVGDVGRRPPWYRLLLWSVLAALSLVRSFTLIENRAEAEAFTAMAVLIIASLGLHFLAVPALHTRQWHQTALVIDFAFTWVFFTAVIIGSSYISSGFDKTKPAILFQGAVLAVLMILLVPLLRGAQKLPKKPV